MNNPLKLAFEQLVACTQGEFEDRLNSVLGLFYGSVCGRVLPDPADFVDAFNPILGAGVFSITPHVTFPGDDQEAHRAFCIAKVLSGIAEQEGYPEKGRIGRVKLGWLGLNKDAQGWAKKLLVARPSGGLSLNGMAELMEAKFLMAELADVFLPLTGRQDHTPGESDILDLPIDS